MNYLYSTLDSLTNWPKSNDDGENEEIQADGGEMEIGPENELLNETNVGQFYISNTFASATGEYRGAAGERVGLRIPSEGVKDVDLGRNLLRVEDVAPMMKPRIEEGLLALSRKADHALVPCSLGTGYPLYKLCDVDLAFEGTIDVVVPSHKTSPSGLYKYPQNAILAGAGVAMMDAPSILVDHRAQEVGMEDVAPELAKTLAVIAHTDVANRGFGMWTMALESIPRGDRADMDLNPPIQRAANSLEPWFSATQWAPWAIENGDIEADEPVPTLAEADRFAIVPQDVELGQHEDLRVIKAPVENAYTVAFWPLDVNWINEHVRRAGADYVDAEIRDPSSPLHQVWKSHTATFGTTDSIDRWEQFWADHIDPRLEDE
ncbi:hypothetical protein [Haloarcula argentinensis]|uniref:Uncharacterized protein n=1 Tax=Haloarcula argentinensis TaxID=43776 RepID=A0A830FMH5_HALAR|nr:hypothetical protein [Haloarcula argentinensis]GGM51901.1 hypothetical protein GCM10009006_36340 [Haloarcula argentinensis]